MKRKERKVRSRVTTQGRDKRLKKATARSTWTQRYRTILLMNEIVSATFVRWKSMKTKTQTYRTFVKIAISFYAYWVLRPRYRRRKQYYMREPLMFFSIICCSLQLYEHWSKASWAQPVFNWIIPLKNPSNIWISVHGTYFPKFLSNCMLAWIFHKNAIHSSALRKVKYFTQLYWMDLANCKCTSPLG